MAVKKKGKKKPGTDMVAWDDKLAKYAKQSVDKEPAGSGGFISTKGGKFSFKGDVLPGDSLRVIVLEAAFDNAYYEGAYDPNNLATPTCFAASFDEGTLVPHDNAAEPEAESCDDCWANKFKSADNGTGKACKNQRRLAVVAADDLSNIDGEAEVAHIRMAPTSLKYWKGYVKKIGNVMGRPPFAVVTDLILEQEDGQTYFVLKPEFVDLVSNDLLGTLEKLMEDSKVDLLSGYSEFKQEEEAPAKRSTTAKKKRSVSKKKAAKKKGKKKAKKSKF